MSLLNRTYSIPLCTADDFSLKLAEVPDALFVALYQTWFIIKTDNKLFIMNHAIEVSTTLVKVISPFKQTKITTA